MKPVSYTHLKTRSLREKVIASLIVFMIVFSNFATLGTMLVSYAADDDADITYSCLLYTSFKILVHVRNQIEVMNL